MLIVAIWIAFGLIVVVFGLSYLLEWLDDQLLNAKLDAEQIAHDGGTVTPSPGYPGGWDLLPLCGHRLRALAGDRLAAYALLRQHADACSAPKRQLITHDCCHLYTWKEPSP